MILPPPIVVAERDDAGQRAERLIVALRIEDQDGVCVVDELLHEESGDE